MRTLTNKLRSPLALLLLLSALSGFTLAVSAQEPWNDPAGTDEKIDRKTGQLKAKQSPTLPDQMQLMNRRATSLIQFLQSEVVVYFSEWTERMAQVLAALLILFSFMRLWREHNGKGGASLFWWFARLGVCLGLIGAGPSIINEMYDVGRDIAQGSSANSVVYRFYDRMQTNFTESYAKIAQGTFTVKVNNQDFVVTPVDGGDAFLGVLYDQQSTIRDFNNRLNESTYTLPRLFAWLGACRGILEGGDIWLTILAGVLLLAFKILAPFMIVVSIDQKLAQRVSYPFLWGTIVMTLVWPSVSYFIRGLAYLFGNVAMAMGDSAPVYVWNEATMQAFRGAQSQPVYTVLFACFTMTVTALCLWVSPVIAYQISMGRVYEGVSNAASTWAGAVIGTVMEWYNSNIGAKLNQQAAQMQATAGYEADTTRAGSELQAANWATRARQATGISQVKGSQFAQLTQLHANTGYQIASHLAGRNYQEAVTDAQAGLAKRNIETGLDRESKEIHISSVQQAENLTAGALGETIGVGGGAISRMSVFGGAGASAAGTVADTVAHLEGIRQRTDRQQDALIEATGQRYQNLRTYEGDMKLNQDINAADVKLASNNNAIELIDAAKLSARQTEVGINHSAAVQISGINRGAGMELQANQIRYDGHVKAAGITRAAAIEVARLHAMERVFTAVSRKIGHEIEEGMRMRHW